MQVIDSMSKARARAPSHVTSSTFAIIVEARLFAAKILLAGVLASIGMVSLIAVEPARAAVPETTITSGPAGATSEATPTFGQAQIDTTDGAPLMLTVRTTGGSLAKGMRAEIVDYAPELHVYYVRGEA